MFVRDSIDQVIDPTEINREYINLPQVVNIVQPLRKTGKAKLMHTFHF